ncbi:MAG TPA: hypothetical protein VJ783_20905 [Pirellulales bacterium]|nr:hypothetical protein [Pirellulales bacterium]
MQFRLKTLFVLTFIVALICAALFALPDAISVIVLFTVGMVTPAATITAIIYGRGAARAFAIAALASGGWALWCLPLLIASATNNLIFNEFTVDEELAIIVKIVFVAYYGVLGLAGLVGVAVRRFLYRGRNHIRPPRDCC